MTFTPLFAHGTGLIPSTLAAATIGALLITGACLVIVGKTQKHAFAGLALCLCGILLAVLFGKFSAALLRLF